MKKIVSILLLVIFVVGGFGTTVFASEEVEGLHECLSKLLMKNYFTEEQFAEIDKKYEESRKDYLLNEYIPARQALGKMETGSVEEEYALIVEQGKRDYKSGLRVSHFANYSYGDQYAKTGNFDYLFDGGEYWTVPGISTDYPVDFDIEGHPISQISYFSFENNKIAKSKNTLKLITDETGIVNFLREKGEKKVKDVKICSYMGQTSGLYIKCPEQEYFLTLYSYYWNSYDRADREHCKFITVSEMTQMCEDGNGERNSVYTTPVKPLFEAEATVLNQEGLLKGNENGLDLLKPLTRIEAATMLLRAMGEDETTDAGQTQTFSDVPSEHWGFGAAENAYSLGLVKGVGDDKFAPDESVTAVQFATMVLRAGAEPEFNWEEAINIMVSKGILSQEDTTTMDFFTRGDMAKIIYEARANGLL